MAKINQQEIKITLSKLLRDDEQVTPIIDNSTFEELVVILQQFIGEDILIETEVK